jgi:hypothetical protein
MQIDFKPLASLIVCATPNGGAEALKKFSLAA